MTPNQWSFWMIKTSWKKLCNYEIYMVTDFEIVAPYTLRIKFDV